MFSTTIKFSPVPAIVYIILTILLLQFSIINAQASTSNSISNSNIYINSLCYNDTRLLEIKGQQFNVSIPMLYCNVIPGQTSCIVDGEPLSKQFQSDCITVLNGIFNYKNILLSCSIANDDDDSISSSSSSGTAEDLFVLQYINYPSCFASTCTDNEINTVFQSVIYPTFESILSQQGYDCIAQESTTNLSSSSSTTTFYNFYFGRNSITLINTVITIAIIIQCVIL